MNIFKWLQLIDLIIRILRLLDDKGKKAVAETIDTLKDEESKNAVAKSIADTINKTT